MNWRAQAFLQAFLERAADGHRFADAFHLRGERGVGLQGFFENKAPNQFRQPSMPHSVIANDVQPKHRVQCHQLGIQIRSPHRGWRRIYCRRRHWVGSREFGVANPN